MNLRTSIPGPLLAAGLLLGAVPSGAAPDASSPTWRWELAAGFDASTHRYSLAVDDTTETIAEFLLQAALEGRSARRVRHRWRLRLDAAAGSELNRQRVDADYRLKSDEAGDRLRGDFTVIARQYRGGTDYNYSSDNAEGRLALRGVPAVLGSTALELRGWGGAHEYRTPSTLEVNDREWGGGVYARSARSLERIWSVGLLGSRRVYPDTSAIDRDQAGVEIIWDGRRLEGGGLSVYHRSGRRVVADETVRPSAWSHWTDVDLAAVAGGGQVLGQLQGEIWNYDYETDVWFDSWRLEGFAGYRGGDLLRVSWTAGLAAAHLDAGDAPDTYTQLGVRGGVEAWHPSVGGNLTVEVGRRSYRDGSVDYGDDGIDGAFELYSDFTYWRLWLVGNWSISRAFSLEAMASYEPENHTEQSDDTALGFANLRLVWRP